MYTNLLPVRYRNIIFIEIYSVCPLFVIQLICIITYLYLFMYIVVIHITSVNISYPTIHSYNFMTFKEAERRKESKNVFIAFVILTFLFIIFGSLHLLLWIQVYIWSHFLRPIAFYFYLPTSFVLLVENMLHFYKLWSNKTLYTHCFIQLLFKSIKKRKICILYCLF